MTVLLKLRPKALIWLALPMAVLLFTGCKAQPLDSESSADTAPADVMEKNWQLTRIENVDAGNSQLVNGVFTLQLKQDGGAFGARLCNRWFGAFEEKNQRFAVNAQGATKALCLPKQNPEGDDKLNAELELRFFDELKNGLTINGSTLELMTSDGQRWIFTEATQP